MLEEKKMGRPTMYGEKLIQTPAYLTQEQRQFLMNKNITFSEFAREMIDRAMRGEIKI